MKFNKKQKKIALISLIVIGAIIISIIGFSFLSLFNQLDRIDCQDGGIDSWTCSATGLASVQIPNVPGQKFDVYINEPTKTAIYFQMICSKMDALAGFNCDTDNPLVASHPEYSASTKYAWYGDDFKREMGKQLIIIEGNSEGKNLKFYGLCNLGQDQICSVTAPEGVQYISQEEDMSHRISPSSIKILFKKSGYTESDFPSDYYRILGNECNNVYLLPSEKTSNDYLTLSECQSHIIPKYETYYSLNNSCSAVYLISSEKTTDDYENYEECKSNTEEISENAGGNITPLVISIILIALFIGVLSWVYFKIKKK
ncbi:MAG: hypothetical protein KKB88_00345 [Nanoarchaeota archaeon]|nr:hypothetical protein [Nanoarchaeota archaeon]